ncbi:DUF2157 domain-containing protein [Rhodovibrionaceae bacterium A322]
MEQKIISEETANQLQEHARSGDFKHQGWLSLSNALRGFGSLVALLGIILIIATNWDEFSSLLKISVFIALLGTTHGLGLFADRKGYGKTAMSLHFLGAGLFMAGIGLMAQIFHLTSESGESYLIWAVMIAPLAFLLRSGPIALLAIVGLALWSLDFFDYLDDIGFEANGLLPALLLCLWLSGVLLRAKDSPFGSYFLYSGAVGTLLYLYILGFAHNYFQLADGTFSMVSQGLPLGLLIVSLLLAPVLRRVEGGYSLLFYIGLLSTLACFVAFTLMAVVQVDWSFDYFSFGYDRSVFLMPLLVSVFAWIGYFCLLIWAVVKGAMTQQFWLLNISMVLLGVGIITRFLDLMGSMLNTGIVFVVAGFLLVLVGYLLERWRRSLMLEHRPVQAGEAGHE